MRLNVRLLHTLRHLSHLSHLSQLSHLSNPSQPSHLCHPPPLRARWRVRVPRYLLAWLAAAAMPLAHAAPHAAPPAAPPAGEAAFLSENEAAMTRMMNDMDIRPTGDVDRDFVAMMTPHHQGAIDMAQAVLRYGKNEQLRRIAQEIIVDQQQEIAAMQLALGQPAPPSAPAPTSPASPASGLPAAAPAAHSAHSHAMRMSHHD
ncbi:DUF305 domain-containing protein [Cupriavidus plantarum]|uniref:DUF305 domain-containing protein n=1 Tax=Cupriavidus plantarum TaxID=942865 RepID=UPI000F15C8B6|nr:hypothetical protein C7417_0349 [Cupriavidus plantarum]